MNRWFKRVLYLVAVLLVAFVAIGAFRAGKPPTVEIVPTVQAIGKSTPFTFRAAEPGRGLSAVRVEVVQGDQTAVVDERTHEPLPPWAVWGDRVREEEWSLQIGKESVEWLQEGDATVRLTAERAGAWLRWPQPVSAEITVPVRLRPPSLAVESGQTYVHQGGCEAVVYRVGKTAVRHGVEAGGWFFPGFPLPGSEDGAQFALFAVPYDTDEGSGVRLVALDEVDNRAEASFIDKFFPVPLHRDTIPVSDRFMEMVVPAILAQTPDLRDRGSLLDNYLMINNELRAANAATIVELAGKSEPAFLWSERFLSLPNAKVTSRFADRRTYIYDGREIDRQDHLGYDLASVQRAEVPAANAGVVVLARYFGIYGNAVVIDHGYGLQSLYGHLSSIAVEEGQTVERGEVVGRTGATGLAGGDHLHFTVLLQGLPVDSKEWWDARWIEHRLKLKLGPALPFDG
jgi:hypothetical protein